MGERKPGHTARHITLCRTLCAAAIARVPIGLAVMLAVACPAYSETPRPTECRTAAATGVVFCKTGNRWIMQTPARQEFAVGDNFPVYEQSMLMDPRRHSLPAVDGPWRYYLRDKVIYKVGADNHKVIEIVGPAP